ncbi:polysaccharide deacetylase family protein [Kitasatospora sp. NPDC088548]|uniref:polysaccharide deacetylase family protein n=2 Tax=unclassified Kitasatospora TaxID=2633591 RepID=UPI0037FAB01D
MLLAAAGMSLVEVAGCRGPLDGDGAAAPTTGAAAPPARVAGVGGAPGASPPPTGAPPDGGSAALAPPELAPPGLVPPALAPAAGQVLTAAEQRPVFELGPERRVVALTIDDGPHPRHTPAVLALLQQYGIRATFFLIGENAAENPGLVQETVARGHHIGNHTWTHPDLRHLSEEKVRDELGRTSDLIHRITGKAPTWFRAPGGDWAPVTLKVSAELGMRSMAWTVDPTDWAEPGADVITSRVLKGVRPGAIVLNHDGGGDRSQTVAALKAYLPALIDSGYSFTAPAG